MSCHENLQVRRTDMASTGSLLVLTERGRVGFVLCSQKNTRTGEANSILRKRDLYGKQGIHHKNLGLLHKIPSG